MTTSTAQALNVLQNYLGAGAIGGGVVVLLLAAGAGIIRGRSLPLWIGWLAVLLGIVTLIPVPNLGVIPAGIWTLIVSVLFYFRPAINLAESARDSAARVPSLSS